jgi:DHA1 family multidrug resistance protein-like MFS transporter
LVCLTSKEDISWASPAIAGGLFGFGNFLVFLGHIGYIALIYPKYSSSAISINGFLRYLFSFAFPLFANQLFENLGVNWGLTLMGFISLILAPIPFLFVKIGPKIRANSEWSGITPKRS